MSDNTVMALNKTVLTIDDEVAITELLSSILQSHGFDVITANNSRDGLKAIVEKSPDAIILDLMMPDINGVDLCKKIRSFSKIPIMVLSAINDPVIVAQVLDSGADDFIAKPMSTNVMIARLNMLLRRSKEMTSYYQAGNSKQIPETAS
jgi:DNA-binding response OmpR family regulator